MRDLLSDFGPLTDSWGVPQFSHLEAGPAAHTCFLGVFWKHHVFRAALLTTADGVAVCHPLGLRPEYQLVVGFLGPHHGVLTLLWFVCV